jgi:amino acid adenylation domain-containing protein
MGKLPHHFGISQRADGYPQTELESIDEQIHQLIRLRGREQPERNAVHAWDGHLTHAQLDGLAARLAALLISHGVGPEDIVPLCFEKSIWAIVSMLAVLHAGAAFVHLNPNDPPRRHDEILRLTGATLIVTAASSKQKWLSHSLDLEVVGISAASTTTWPDQTADSENRGCPDNAAYVIYTSGSSGRPKGVVVEHRAISTSCAYQGILLGMTESTRALQFAAYTFDACITEILGTLLHGGCVCVPSEAQRLDELEMTCDAMQIDWALMTPTVARILDPEAIPTLKTLVLGGEAVYDQDRIRWQGHARIIVAYGPTECSVICVADMGDQKTDKATIGRPIGCHAWVVNPADHHQLASSHEIGELLVEGPILARGYLGNIELTEAAFIDGPHWLQWTEDKSSRLYKTGDLVRYQEDGNLMYMGRKDDQVKIRGQRIELGEIEHCIREYLPELSETVVEAIKPSHDPQTAVLAAFTRCGNSQVYRIPSSDLHETLAKCLPESMIPALHLAVTKLPLTSSGKTDRRRLRELGESFLATEHEYKSHNSRARVERPPPNEALNVLKQSVARVLNLTTERVDFDASFIKLGGDSISAMQVVNFCRKAGYNIAVKDIMKDGEVLRKVVQMLTSSQSSALSANLEDQDDQPFSLSPIQTMYLDAFPAKEDTFDQSFYLHLRHHITASKFAAALAAVVTKHSALRGRIKQRDDMSFYQITTGDGPRSIQLRCHTSTDDDTVGTAMRRSRLSLDHYYGPNLAADLFDDQNSQAIFITVNHLFVDLVSWRIILQDIEDLLINQEIAPMHSLSFQSWCRLQHEHALNNLLPERALPFNIQPPDLAYWCGQDHREIWSSTEKTEFMLSKEVTTSILSSCNVPFRSEVIDLFLAGLVHSFKAIFPERDVPTIFNEGHGREPWDDSLDLTQTVGWFTTFVPIPYSCSTSESLPEIVRRIKGVRRQMPSKGYSYFTSRFLNPQGIAVFHLPSSVEILVNYHGTYQQLERPESLFQQGQPPDGMDLDVSFQGSRFAVFNLSISIKNGQALVSFMYPKAIKYVDKVRRWIEKFDITMQDIAQVLPATAPMCSLGDFPLAFSDHTSLDSFAHKMTHEPWSLQMTEIEDVYPCTPMQQAMLRAQMDDPTVYWFVSVFRIACPNQDDLIDTERLRCAWQAVVQRHSVLRTVFLDNLPGTGTWGQLVLRAREPAVTHVRQIKDEMIALDSSQEVMSRENRKELGHYLTIFQDADGRVDCMLQINHAIVDGHSIAMLHHDLSAAYLATLPAEPAASFASYVSYLQQWDAQDARAYWSRYLEDLEPCLFPTVNCAIPSPSTENEAPIPTGKLSGNAAERVMSKQAIAVSRTETLSLNTEEMCGFCSHHGVTMFTLISTAWAITLNRFSGSEHVCFGYLSSGRDLPIKEIAEIMGPTINTLVARFDLPSAPIAQILKKQQADYIQHGSHASLSLAEVEHSVTARGSRLFNTVITYQKQYDRILTPTDIRVQSLLEHDPNEVCCVSFLHHFRANDSSSVRCQSSCGRNKL